MTPKKSSDIRANQEALLPLTPTKIGALESTEEDFLTTYTFLRDELVKNEDSVQSTETAMDTD